jgi:hypothetical protein
MKPRKLIARVKEVGGIIQLREDGHTMLFGVPPGNEELKAEVRAQKEVIRAILCKQHNAKRRRKAPPLAPEPAQPVFITVCCRCAKFPHAHVHRDLEAELHTIKAPGDVVFEYLREQVKKYGIQGDALPATQAVPEKKVELSPWGRPKIKGYTKYRWEETK